MTNFTIHTPQESDGERKQALEDAQKKYGFVPNLLGGLAEAPAAARAYMSLGAEVSATSFSATERHVVWFAVNYYNNCHYCMPAHTAIAKGEKVPDDVIEAARQGGGYADPKLQALHDFATAMTDQRGVVDEATLEAFFAAGYEKQQVLEVIIIIAHKTISNYANHVMKTPVDEAFASFAWEK